MKFLERQTIGGQLATAICVLLVPLIAAVLWSASRTRLERQHEVQQTAASVASAAAAHLEQYIESLDATAAAALQHPGVISLDPACCQQLFAQLLEHQPLLTNVVLTLPDGTLRALAAGPPGANGQISRAWIGKVTSTGEPVISEWYKGQVSGKPVVTLGYPVRAADGSITGVLGLSVDLSRLDRVFAEVPLPAGSVITLIDRSGLVLARSVDAERFIGKMSSPENHSLVLCIDIGGEAVGALGVHPLDDVYRRSAEVGYWLGEPYWGRGIISRAVPMICEQAFAKNPELVRLQASVYAWNPASARVLEKAGFTREGVLAKSVFKDGTLLDSWMYAKLR